MSKHAKQISRPNARVILVALLAVAFIAAFFGMFNATANDSATPATQQVLGRAETCQVNASSVCVVNHGLGVKPTAVVVTPAAPGQNVTIDVSKITDTSYTVKFLWRDGTGFKKGTTIKYNVVYTFVAESNPTTPPTTEPTSPPVTTPPVTTPPPTTPTVPADKSCSPTNTVAHFTGEGSDAIADAPSSEKSGQYNVSAEQWAVQNDYSSNLCAYSKDNWYVEIKATDHGDGAVQSYPSIRKIYHDWGGPDNFDNDPKLSSFPQLKVAVAQTDPVDCTGCVYEQAFDIWLNGIGDGASTTELMIWTHNQGQEPYGDLRGTVDVDGRTWNLYYGAPGYVAFVPKNNENIKSGTFDIKAFIEKAAENHLITKNPTDPTVGQISYGVEPVTTKGVFKRWDFTKFNILDK